MWNAKDKPLNQTNLSSVPNMSGTLTGWFQKMIFNVVTKEIKNYQTVETTVDVEFLGTWQPLSPEKIKMKSEAQWSWPWFQVHAHTALKLKTDDVIRYRGVQYRVDAKLDYSESGFVEYHIHQDYTGAGPEVIVATP